MIISKQLIADLKAESFTLCDSLAIDPAMIPLVKHLSDTKGQFSDTAVAYCCSGHGSNSGHIILASCSMTVITKMLSDYMEQVIECRRKRKHPKQNKLTDIKLLVIGKPNLGKEALRFVGHRFNFQGYDGLKELYCFFGIDHLYPHDVIKQDKELKRAVPTSNHNRLADQLASELKEKILKTLVKHSLNNE